MSLYLKRSLITPEHIIGRSPLQHDCDNEFCWCSPELKQVCPECCEEGLLITPKCWRCEGTGLVDLYDDILPVLIIHRDL
jgi:hypothetical protein